MPVCYYYCCLIVIHIEFLKNIIHIPLDDAELTEWVAMELFRKTLCDTDESHEHVLYTFESEHPLGVCIFPVGAHQGNSGKINVPGASSLRISFDKRTRTGSDVLCFFRDEDMASDPKTFRWVVGRIFISVLMV
jgi:hypothetical protein